MNSNRPEYKICGGMAEIHDLVPGSKGEHLHVLQELKLGLPFIQQFPNYLE